MDSPTVWMEYFRKFADGNSIKSNDSEDGNQASNPQASHPVTWYDVTYGWALLVIKDSYNLMNYGWIFSPECPTLQARLERCMSRCITMRQNADCCLVNKMWLGELGSILNLWMAWLTRWQHHKRDKSKDGTVRHIIFPFPRIMFWLAYSMQEKVE